MKKAISKGGQQVFEERIPFLYQKVAVTHVVHSVHHPYPFSREFTSQLQLSRFNSRRGDSPPYSPLALQVVC